MVNKSGVALWNTFSSEYAKINTLISLSFFFSLKWMSLSHCILVSNLTPFHLTKWDIWTFSFGPLLHQKPKKSNTCRTLTKRQYLHSLLLQNILDLVVAILLPPLLNNHCHTTMTSLPPPSNSHSHAMHLAFVEAELHEILFGLELA